MHQTIIIRYDEIIPFTVNIIFCQHYRSIVAVKERCREWHEGVVQCSVSVSESLMLPQAFTKARLHADCQNNTTLYQGFPATDDRVNCICFLGQDTMLTSMCLGDAWTNTGGWWPN